MKKLFVILSFLALVATGCQHPTEVTLVPNDSGADLDVAAISVSESVAIDTTAVLPSDGMKFAGIVLLNDVKYDHGTGVQEIAFSNALFSDWARPRYDGQRIIGYWGFPIGGLTINDSAMVEFPHFVRGTTHIDFAGWEYALSLTGRYRPGTLYQWHALRDTIGAVDMSIVSPESLTVHSPAGGSRVPHDRDLVMRWTGNGDMTIVVSLYDPAVHKARPVLQLRPTVNRGHAVLSAKILSGLALKGRSFVLTFVLAHRSTSTVIGQFQGGVLIQAASVYNSYVEIL